jgi:hypothetical protein
MTPTEYARAALLALLIVLAGCGSTGATAATGSGNSSMITRAQLDATPTSDLYEAVRRLRPTWLSARGSTTLLGDQAQVIVYLDGTRMGGVNMLRNTEISSVISLQFLSPSEATNRYGTDHAAGVILVRTR